MAQIYAPDAFPKRCTCCGVTYMEEGWITLLFKGIIEVDDNVFAEMRNCRLCDSTIAVQLQEK